MKVAALVIPLRGQRVHRNAVTDLVCDTDTPEVSHTDLPVSLLCTDDAPFAIGALVPRLPARFEVV